MARSFTYDRPLDVKIIPVSENSNHEFQTLLGIKKEVEDVPSDEEVGLSEFESANNLELSSANTSKVKPDDGKGENHPHVVAKFRDLLTRSGQSYGITGKKRKREREYKTEDKLNSCEVDRIKRRRSGSSVTSEIPNHRCELGITSERRNTRSSIRQKICSNSDNVDKNSMLNSSDLNEIGDKAKNEINSNSIPMTVLRKSANMHCDICGLCFTSHQNLQAHKSYYSTDGKYKCNICGLRFPRLTLLSRHKRIAHSGIPHKYWYRNKCHICMDRFKKKLSLIVHISHLHAKELASNKKSKSLYKEVVLRHIAIGKRRKTQACVNNSELSVKSAPPINSNNYEVSLDEITTFYEDFIESVGDPNNEDAHVGETLSVQQDAEYQNISLDNQATKGAVNSDCKKVSTSSTGQRLEYVEASNLAQCDRVKVIEQQKLEPLITDSEQTSIGLKKPQEIIGNSACSSKKVLNENKGMQESKEHTKKLNELPLGSDRSLSTLSEDVSLQLQQDSVQRLGKSANESIAYKFNPQQDATNEKKRPPSLEQLNYQVGTVLSHDELGEKVDVTTVNADVDNSAVKRINLIKTDDFGESRQSNFISCQDKDIDNRNCESISLTMAVSSSSIPSTSSQSVEFHDATMLRSYEMSNYRNIKDVRVSLVKLENMVDLPKIRTPKSSVCKITRLLNTEKPNCYVGEKPFVNRGRWRISRQNQRKKVEYYKKSRSFVEKTHGTIGYCPQVLSNDGGSEERGEWETAKPTDRHCYVCNKFFQNKGLLVSHYIKIHVEPGSFRCCLCNAHLKSPKRLRIHLFKHCNMPIEKIFLKFCRSCKIELNMFSLKTLCVSCEKGYKLNRLKFVQSKLEYIPMSNNQRLAHTLACKKICSSDNGRELLHETPVVMNSNDVNVLSVAEDSAKNGLKVECSITSDEISKNSKCLGSNSSFSQSSTAHTDLEYRKPKSQIGVISDDCKKITRTCNYKTRTKTLKVGSKKRFKSIRFFTHDKRCTKNLMTRRRHELFKRKSTGKRINRPHFRSNTKQSFYHRCKTCGLNCCCGKNLKIHERRYSTNGKNACKMCGLIFAWKHELVIHMKTAHNPKPLFSRRIRCEICNQGFYNKKFLRIHLAHFHNIKYFQCQVGKIKFDTSQYLNDHRRYYSKTINLPCDCCDQTFNCKYALEYHKVHIHNPEEPKVYKYSCDRCDCAFPDKLSLQAHIGHLHVVQDHDSLVTTSMKGAHAPADLHLEDIGFSNKTEDAFINSNVEMNNSNARKHENEIQCEETMHETTNSATTRTHILSQYKCDICKISFVEPHNMLDHEWEYSNYGTNACDVCNRKFMTKSHLKKHKVKHFRRDVICKYKCHVCKEDFLTEDDLKMHGLHLHGPQFMFKKFSERSDSRESSNSSCKKINDSDGVSKLSINDNTDNSLGVMGSEIAENERILLFQKISNRLSAELLHRNSTEETYCCDFCTARFGTWCLLKNHMKKHAYCPYYTNSSKYLCLICKNTFRTNDILRAHVIHYHTLDHKQSTTTKPESSEESILDESLKSQTGVNRDPTRVSDRDVQDTVETLPSKHAALNQSFSLPKHCNAVDDSGTIPSETKIQSFNPTDNAHVLQHNHDHPPSLSQEIQCKTKTILGDSDSGQSNDENSRDTESTNVHTIENISPQAEVTSVSVSEEWFIGDLKNLICTICTQNFDSTEEIQAHFTSVHMMNGEYACTFCGEIFSYFMDLKQHIFRLDEDSENYTCREKYRQLAELAGNTSSLKNHKGSKQNEKNLQLLSLDEADIPSKSSEKPSPNLINLGTFNICDESFPNITTSLKHWDSCFGKDRFRCDICDIMFIDQNVLNKHNMKHCQQGQEPHIARNQSSFRLNVNDRTFQIRMQYGDVLANKLQDGALITSSLVNTNISGKVRRGPISSDKILKHITSSRLRAQIAKILHIDENEDEPHVNTQIISTNAASSKVDLQLSFESQQDTDLSNKLDVVERCETEQSVGEFIENSSSRFHRDVSSIVTYPVQSTPSADILNSSDEKSSYKMLIASTNDDDETEKRHAPIKHIENKCTQQKQPSLQSHVLSTGQNSASIVPTIRSSRMLDHTHIPSSQKSRPSDCADEKRLEIVPLSSDSNGNSTYFILIKPIVGSSNDTEALDAVRTPIEKSPLIEYPSKRLPRSIPSTSGSDVRLLYYKCVESSSDSPSERVDNKPTVIQRGHNLKPHLHGGIQKLRLKILPNRSNIVISPLRGSPYEWNSKAGNSGGNNLHNASDPRGVSSGSNDNTTILTRFNMAGDSPTYPVLNSSHDGEQKGVDDRANDAHKELKFNKFRKNILRCRYCTMLFKEKNQLLEHMLIHKANNQCPACGLSFSNDKALQQHLPEHRSSRCIECNKVNFFNDPPCYPAGTFVFCSECKAVLPPPLRTLTQSSTNLNRRIMKCGICMETFNTISQMSVHFRNTHLSFVCSICSLGFSSQINLNKHIEAHKAK
ncbi:uncharacterized protein LOC124295489 isoform X1 [Neodiprion lecontei]|uniref:Uncharacterized protein LOC124295489 isoform X1 n=1 Tax=Neodiprion lecontei TaxID=441921 RepID=A0ABM3GN63_NEOLC|nr:uncharacterized protein LOC124295489 isoform X1 [Neodiprion lecontei]XP_046601675.1 uncharacterized protein LOC124295489 isoform X1 [Neodiprion lecontei]